MEKKYILLTGATGGIGSAIAKLLMFLGYTIYAPVRDMDRAKGIYGDDERIICTLVSIENAKDTHNYIFGLHKQGIVFDFVILAAGKFIWDDKFEGNTPEEKQKNAIEKMMVINYVTSETVINALLSVYHDKSGITLAKTTLVIISSQAARFEVGHPFRVNEEGYVVSKTKLSAFGRDVAALEKFFSVVIQEPGRVGTESAKESFNAKTIGADLDWEKDEKKPEEYADELVHGVLNL